MGKYIRYKDDKEISNLYIEKYEIGRKMGIFFICLFSVGALGSFIAMMVSVNDVVSITFISGAIFLAFCVLMLIVSSICLVIVNKWLKLNRRGE